MKCYLVFVGSVLIFFDNSLTQSFVNKGSEHQCVIGRRGANYATELLQQKKQAPVGGDFIELGSSLITLLNLAQEIGSSNNLRFRQAADKLRNQFARSFALRYDLEKSQFLSTALSSIDGDSHLTEGTIFCCNEHPSRMEIMNCRVLLHNFDIAWGSCRVRWTSVSFAVFLLPCDFWTKSAILFRSAFYSARNKRSNGLSPPARARSMIVLVSL